MDKIILRGNINEKFGYSLVKHSSIEFYLPYEIFGLLKLKDYQSFLEAVTEESYYQFSEIGGFQIGPVDGSPYDGIEALSENEVEIGLGEESVRILKNDFLELCSDFGHKAIEAIVWFKLEDRKLVNNEWAEKMKILVNIIDQKIKD